MSVSDDFKNGGSYLISAANADIYINDGQEEIGRQDGQFIIPPNQMDELLESHPNDPRAWEQQLGLPQNSLRDDVYRVDVYHPEDFNLREATPDLSGSNDLYVADGKTAGGYDEAVCSPFPNPSLEENSNIGQVSKVPIDKEELKNHPYDPNMMPDRRDEWPKNNNSELSNQQETDFNSLNNFTPTSGNDIPEGANVDCLTKGIDKEDDSSNLSKHNGMEM